MKGRPTSFQIKTYGKHVGGLDVGCAYVAANNPDDFDVSVEEEKPGLWNVTVTPKKSGTVIIFWFFFPLRVIFLKRS